MKYEAVNGQWPETIPPLTGEEAIAAAKRLYRFAMKKSWPGRWAVTSGRRYTWPRRGVFYVNPDRKPSWGDEALAHGWRDLVHMLSHYCHQKQFPKAKPHDGRHHFLEREMVAYVLSHDWLSGKLRPKVRAKVVPDAAARLAARAARWEAKRRRAETALRKIARQRAQQARREAVPKLGTIGPKLGTNREQLTTLADRA
jgi:hypothetical protein